MSIAVEEKIRLLAATDVTLQSYFGVSPFRMFDRQLTPSELIQGVCVTVVRPSTLPRMVCQTGYLTLSQPCIRFTVYAWTGTTKQRGVLNAPTKAREAKAALITWLGSVACFSSSAQFDSPVTAPPNHPNFVLTERADLDFKLEPPAYVEQFDVRIMNLEN